MPPAGIRTAVTVLAIGLMMCLAAGVQRTPAGEDAYRANNLGVARLEQYDYASAAAAFRQAIALDPDIALAHVNLAIALFYAGDREGARREADLARQRLPEVPQPRYVLGLIARADNQPAAAVAAFSQVHRMDPSDVGTAVNLGQLALEERRYQDAVQLFTDATAAEPYNATAAYGLATALLRNGSTAEGTRAMERFTRLRGSGFAVTYSQNYLEQGRYAEAIASTGAEADLVDEHVPDVTFTDVTETLLPPATRRGANAANPTSSTKAPPPPDAATLVQSLPHADRAEVLQALATGPGGAVALADLFGSGRLDLIEADATGLHVYRNESGRFADVTREVGLAGAAGGVPRATGDGAGGVPTGIIPGDYDNDGRPDLFVLREGGYTLYHNTPAGFVDVTKTAGLPESGELARTAAWADVDHDGDLDLIVGGVSRLRLFRNDGNGTFTDITSQAGLAASVQSIGIVATDFDDRRDIDLLVAGYGGPLLFRNMRDGTFRSVAAETRLAGPALQRHLSALAAADFNKDDFTDFFFGRLDAPGVFAASDGREHFALADAPAETTGTLAAQFLDYDQDGLLDLFAITATGPRLLRNLGAGRWSDVTSRAIPANVRQRLLGMPSIASGDLDGSGRTDVVIRTAGSGLIILRGQGHPGRSLRVGLKARVSNRSAVGTKIEMRAGSLRQKLETYAATPAVAPVNLVFGLGSRPRVDAVRVLWPSGIVQAETAVPDPLLVTELDRKPSSCPFLFAWNGSRFEFITDFLGGGEMGYWEAPGVRNVPDSDEYVRLTDRQLRPRDGKYELRITNELEEALFLDRVQLVSIAHPADVEVFPNEGMGSAPKPFGLIVTRGARPPIAAVDEHGHDVLDLVARLDRRYPDDFTLERIRGYAGPHHLTLTLPSGDRRLLLLTGRTDYAFSTDNVAASQAGLKLEPPSLQIPDGHGRWRTVIEDIGIPVGRPQTVPVDLTGRVPPAVQQVRISTTMRVYWDQVLVAASDHGVPTEMVRLEPATALLRWRGFSAEWTPDGREPFSYDYSRVTPVSPWKNLPGRYTREGDVRELLSKVDDMFVVSRPGDEIALSFDARRLPALPAGWARTFLLYADGFSKEMDLHSASPDELAPLPFHGMSRYPYEAPEAYPSGPAYRAYLTRYNTRVVKRMLPSLDAIASRRMGMQN